MFSNLSHVLVTFSIEKLSFFNILPELWIIELGKIHQLDGYQTEII